MDTSTLIVGRCDILSTTARTLIERLNAELSATYPEQGACHFRLDADEVAEGRGAFLVASRSQKPIGCGAVRRIDAQTGELKRMFVSPEERGRGVGNAILTALEAEARRLGLSRLVLETGIRQHQAIILYKRAGFFPIDPFGEYTTSPLSICFARDLTTQIR
ncbi:MAG TPA: GNAT family N-acetyltransferase [Tepidisphaeraceae bacterium]|jgi:GNAT superfamily N-acetyltransferase|nr:GNAT family N-acetyltransferase [Tepidisphaeraceae bacterium]